ncbi:FYVE zinc finger family protein [Tritrichomonas foetus]|uniref:FYVE zinc finger family protein n=1 Tax=Tritrichomonas foetus TaxID=1144522 RepID=A0A1J4KIZ7_9EUKA|nr:FYVE zinc finger family protein [Tritrichomonas foetus]|eukprot:OHT09293.1 FYVE zinc finger family protein [Tritrichomonas foetus]
MALDWNHGFGVDLSLTDDRENFSKSLRNLCYFKPSAPSFSDFAIDPNILLCAQIPGITPNETFFIDLLDKKPEFSIIVIDFISYERVFLSDLNMIIEKILHATADTSYSKLDRTLTPYIKTVQANHQEFLNLLFALSSNVPPNFVELLVDSYSATPKIFQSHESYLSTFLTVETVAQAFSVAQTDHLIDILNGRTIIELLHAPVTWLNTASKFSLQLKKTVAAMIDQKRSESLELFAEKCKNLCATIDSIPKLEQISKYFVTEPFPIVMPGRRFIKQGNADKHCRKKVDHREILLFSDYFGYAQNKGGKYLLPQFYKLVELKAVEPTDNPDSKCLYIYAPRKSFVLEFESLPKRKEWFRALKSAIDNARENHDGPLQEINFAPIWMPDNETSVCMVCQTQFSLLLRKHHCRACGRVVCKNCLPYKIIIPNINAKKEVPVCQKCYDENQPSKQ